jgi:putative ABC transport system substrate-binding protein
MVTRRGFLHGSVAALLVAPLAVRAQPAARKMPRIGLLQPGVRLPAWVGAFRRRLGQVGYVEGQNIGVEHRLAEGWAEQRAVIAEFMRLKVDVIVTWGMPAVLAAKHETRAIPVVGVVPDPVETYFITGLARLNRTFTGVSIQPNEKDLPTLRLLREALPTISRISVLHSTSLDPRLAAALDWMHEDPPILFGLTLLILDDSFVTGPLKPILGLRRHRPPASSEISALIVGNGLMVKGVVVRDILHRAAVYVDKILKGARAAELPIEEPPGYELIIDANTANALGLTIPPKVIA